MGCVCVQQKPGLEKNNEKLRIVANSQIVHKVAIAKKTLNYNFDNMDLKNLEFLNELVAKDENSKPPEMEKFPVKVFSANNNSIENIPMNFFKKIGKITKIDFSYNQFRQIELPICEKIELKILFFNNNKINFIPGEFQYLRNLKELNLSFNLLEDSEVSEKLVNLQNCESIKLSCNRLKIFPINLITNPKINTLCLDNNQIDNKILDEYWNKTSLQNLDLSFNKLSYQQLPEGLFNYSKVSNLNLKGNRIILEELKNIDGFDKFHDRRKKRKDQGFIHNLAINFDLCGLDG